MKKIGFIGLGTMGSQMARRLLSVGYALTVYNRTIEKTNELVNCGAWSAKSPKQVVENSDVIITMVSDDQAVRDVVEDELGAFAGAMPGTVFIDCSTISVKTTKYLARRAGKLGYYWLDAPVLGGPAAAEAGELPFVVGGSKKILKENIEIFNTLGKVVWMGESGMGQAAKIVHNMVCGVMLAAYSEAILLGEKFGLTKKQILEILLNHAVGSPLLKAKASKFEQNCWKPSFALTMMDKDLTLALDGAEELQLILPTLSSTKKLYDLAKARGFGALDSSAVIKVLEGGKL